MRCVHGRAKPRASTALRQAGVGAINWQHGNIDPGVVTQNVRFRPNGQRYPLHRMSEVKHEIDMSDTQCNTHNPGDGSEPDLDPGHLAGANEQRSR